MTEEKRYWYNVKTGEVEDGPQSMWKDRIGPFATREEAANALSIYEQRNRAWDEADEETRIGEYSKSCVHHQGTPSEEHHRDMRGPHPIRLGAYQRIALQMMAPVVG